MSLGEITDNKESKNKKNELIFENKQNQIEINNRRLNDLDKHIKEIKEMDHMEKIMPINNEKKAKEKEINNEIKKIEYGNTEAKLNLESDIQKESNKHKEELQKLENEGEKHNESYKLEIKKLNNEFILRMKELDLKKNEQNNSYKENLEKIKAEFEKEKLENEKIIKEMELKREEKKLQSHERRRETDIIEKKIELMHEEEMHIFRAKSFENIKNLELKFNYDMKKLEFEHLQKMKDKENEHLSKNENLLLKMDVIKKIEKMDYNQAISFLGLNNNNNDIESKNKNMPINNQSINNYFNYYNYPPPSYVSNWNPNNPYNINNNFSNITSLSSPNLPYFPNYNSNTFIVRNNMFPDFTLSRSLSEISKRNTYTTPDIDSYFSKRENENTIFNNTYFICKKCFKIPCIKFIDFKTIKIKCGDCKKQIINLNNFIQNYSKKLEKINEIKDFINNHLKCNKHQKKFKYYCEACNQDICKDCLLKKSHKRHNLKLFDFLIFDFNIKMKTIFTKINDNENKNKDLYYLVKVINSNYQKYQSYNVFKTVKNIYNFLLFNTEGVSNNVPIKEVKITNIKEINNINNPYLITSIIISNQIIKLEEICKADLVNLDVLELPNNNINDISPLKNAKFVNLKLLNLLNNKIDDKNISSFKDIYFKYLSNFNLSLNLITNFEIFDCAKNFPNLNNFAINSNKFALKDTDLNHMYDLYSLEKLYLSDGVLSDNSIQILNKFKLDKLKIFHLNSNYLSSLSSLKEIKFEQLKEIYLNGNELTSFDGLENFSNLTKIEIRNNKINDIDALGDFIKKMPMLKKINLSGNRINIKSEKNIKKIEILKEKYNDIKIVI